MSEDEIDDLPEWNPEFRLTKPLTINGQEITTLELKEPVIADIEFATQEGKGARTGNIQTARRLFARITGIDAAALSQMGVRDMNRLSKRIFDFFNGSEDAAEADPSGPETD